MRDPSRLYNFYNELRDVHMNYFPDLRFGQFMLNFLSWININKNKDPFFPGEGEMINLLKEYASEIRG